MPKVKANVKCFIDNSLREEGDVFEYNGPPNSCVSLDEDDNDMEDVKIRKSLKTKGKRNDIDTDAD